LNIQGTDNLFFRTIFYGSPNPGLLLDIDAPVFTIVDANQAYLNASNTIRDEIIGQSSIQFFTENPADAKLKGKKSIVASLNKVIKTAKLDVLSNFKYDIQFKDKSGFEAKYWDITNTPVMNSEEKVEYIFTSSNDVTEQYLAQLENALMLENTEESFLLIDLNLRIINFNARFARNYKDVFDIDVIKGESILTYAQPERRDMVRAIYEKTYQGETIQTEMTFPFKDGVQRTFHLKYKPAYNSENQIVGSFVTMNDITDRRNNEIQLEKIYKQARIGVWDVDLINETVTWSQVTRELHEVDEDYLPGYSNAINFYKEGWSRNRINEVVERLLNTGEPWSEELIIVTAKGNERWIRTIGEADFIDGKCTRFFGSFQDIHEKKSAEIKIQELNAELTKQTEDLKKSNEELESFAYIASHDLQEPLRMVTSFLNQVEKKYDHVLDERGKRYIFYAVDGAKRMRQIILDLLEYSRVGRTDTEIRAVNLNDVLDNIFILNRKIIDELKADIFVDKMPTILVSKIAIQQVFQNLVNNAIKYRKKDIDPVIKISCKDLGNQWQFSVSDNGIGINPEYHKRIFIIFQRLHAKDEYSGSGVGLAISKKIVESYGGKIWVESKEDEGSIFYFTINKQSEL
jgi:PAS domain S-box-containing protein